MDHILIAEEFERLKNLNRESTDQGQRHALEIVVLDEFVKVDREEFERDDQVITEHAVVLYLNDVVLVVGVLPLQVLKDAQLYSCLVLVTLFVLNYFDCNNFIGFVVKTL